ncbi:sigma 54-interacting transcriptional regulator [Myxococcota bacterium]|nr:sigma 54-interacting transcriptional regulator [Myxococcota bacterium]
MTTPATTATADRLDPATHRIRRSFLTQVFDPAAGVVFRHLALSAHRMTLGRDPQTRTTHFEVPDAQASRQHCELAYVPETGHYRVRDLGSKNGTTVDGAPLADEAVPLVGCGVLRVGESLFVYNELESPIGVERLQVTDGLSPRRALAERMADMAAPTLVPILLTGPTGAGKELLARRVHEASGRSGPLVAVNCATFSRELLASELFGHVKGAFSGAAASRAGLFLSANGGTLFLDEVADFPADQQPALLRALQERRIRPVGSDRELNVDVRVVSATHRDLTQLQASAAFREDLFGRLAGVTIVLPGLCDRREEVLALFCGALGHDAPPLTVAAAEALLLHDWPYNVREIQQAAATVRMFAPAVQCIGPGLLPAAIQRAARTRSTPDTADAQAFDRDHLIRLLTAHEGNIASVGRSLGKTRQQVYRLLQAHRIDPTAFRS